MKRRRYFAALLCLLLIVFTVPVYAAGEKTITRDFYFEADSPDNLSYDAEEEIEVDGKHYRLTDVSCEIYSEPIVVKKKFKTKDKVADEYITQNIEGVEFKLYPPSKIKWKDKNITLTKEYASEDDAPEVIEYEGKELKLKTVENGERKDNVSTVAVFYSDSADTTEYEFNGKLVELRGGEPKWSGWQSDYAEYLGLSNNNDYSITGSAWQGRAVRQPDGTYIRRATVFGTKNVRYVIATFDLRGDAERYAATVTYTSKYIAHAKVIYERYITTRQKVIYAAVGIVALALMTATVLFLISKRNKNEYE